MNNVAAFATKRVMQVESFKVKKAMLIWLRSSGATGLGSQINKAVTRERPTQQGQVRAEVIPRMISKTSVIA